MRTNGKNIFQGQLTIGVDLGDRSSAYCVLNEAGEIVLEHKLATTPEAIKQVFGSMPRCRLAMETGTHSPWVSRLLTALGHEVIVGHAQKVRLISKSRRKDDRLDARTLARLARIDPELLSPVKHRSAQAQLHLTEIRARAELVSARTALVNAARGLVKSYGERIRKCGTQQFGRETTSGLSAGLREALEPLLREVESLNERIQEYDRRIEKMAKQTYPETALLKQVKGVGDLISTAYVLTIEDPPSLPEESRRRMFCGVATRTEEFWRERTPDAHKQGRRRVSTDAAGAGSALHFRTLWRRQRFAALGTEACRARREKRQETGSGCGSSQAGGTAASVVGEWRGVRTAAQ
jgi:transposase